MISEHFDLLQQWVKAEEEAKAVKPIIAKELALRKKVFASFLAEPKEGTNYVELGNGWRLKLTHKLSRTVDEAALPAVAELLLESKGVYIDTLVDYKPSLKLAVYRELSDENKQVFDQALIMRPSTPTVEMVPPKETE